MEIYVIRHGQTEANAENRLQGRSDTPLTDTGKRQIKNVIAAVKRRGIEVLISSPLKRALDTAKLIAQELKTDIRVDPDLREICYGDWEGQSKEELTETDAWDRRVADKYNFTHPGSYEGTQGSSYAAIYGRVSKFCTTLRDSDYETVGVVTHLGVLRNMKRHFQDVSGQTAVEFTPSSDRIYRISTGERTDTELLTPR